MEEGLIKYEGAKPDVVILDIMLPNIDGYEVCKRLREKGYDCCIIMLTAKAQDMDKIIGLDIGADDYMVKPFNPMELISRINANLRKIKRNNISSDVLTYRQLKLNKSSQKFYKNDVEIEFTFREFSLMEVFMGNINKALSRENLLDLSVDYSPDNGNVYFDIKSMDNKISFITTDSGKGFSRENIKLATKQFYMGDCSRAFIMGWDCILHNPS